MKIFSNVVLICLASLLMFNACGNNDMLDQDREICNNNIDDDGDGLIDCGDEDCVGAFDCLNASEICDNNIDDNGDGLVDCDDEDCANFQDCDPNLGWIEISNFDGSIEDFMVIEDQMFVVGEFTERENSICIWSTILTNNSFDDNTNSLGGSGIRELTFFDDQVYGVGSFFSNGSGGVVIWNGTSWDVTGPSGVNKRHSSIYSDETTLYIGSEQGIVSSKTKNSDFEQFPTSLGENIVYSILEHNGTLVVAGAFVDAVAYWDGGSWQALGGGANNTIYKLIEFQGQLIAAGNFREIGGKDIFGIAAWDGTSWSSLDGSVIGIYDSIRDMLVYEDELYIAGNFDVIGDVDVKHLAKWNGSEWSSLGNDFDDLITCIGVYNDRLYAATSGFPATYLYRLNL